MMTILFLLQAWHGYRFTFTQRHSAFLADASSLVSFSPKMSSCWESVFSGLPWPTICMSQQAAYIQDAFPGIFFWIAIKALLFYFATKTLFFSHKKDCFSKKTALSCIFFRISIDNLGPYMCYVIFIQELLFVKYYLFLIDSLFLLLLMQQEHHYLFWDLLQFSLQKLYKYRFLLDALRTRVWIVLTAHLFVLGNLL